MTKIKSLFLAANPVDTERLSLDREVREISSKIRASEYRDSIELISVWAVRPDDLIQSLNEYKPQIVHFSGHGSSTGEIVLVNDLNNVKPVSPHALRTLFTTLKDNIHVVILNACYSKIQAEAITEVIDCAIGMSNTITDDAAITFVASFYRALGFGRSVQEAFNQGTTAILLAGLSEENIPELLVRSGIDPTKLILMKGGAGNEDSESAWMDEASARPSDQSARFQEPSIAYQVESSERNKMRFWKTLPGFLTGFATVITAIGGLLGILNQLGLFTPDMASSPPATFASQSMPTNTINSEATYTSTISPPISTNTPTQVLIGTEKVEVKQMVNPVDGASYVYVPAGKATVGSTEQEIIDAITLCKARRGSGTDEGGKFCAFSWFENETITTTIELPGFWIKRTEVTNAQYGKCVTDEACTPSDGRNYVTPDVSELPVSVSWHQAMEYAIWAGARLPTEAEWELAACGTDGRVFPWGNYLDDSLGTRLNYCDKSCQLGASDSQIDDGANGLSPVGNYPNGVSPYSLFDMAGNAWEWTSSLDKSYAPNGYDPADGRENLNTPGNRIVRGGSWAADLSNVRCSARWGLPVVIAGDDMAPGFRVVLLESNN